MDVSGKNYFNDIELSCYFTGLIFVRLLLGTIIQKITNKQTNKQCMMCGYTVADSISMYTFDTGRYNPYPGVLWEGREMYCNSEFQLL